MLVSEWTVRMTLNWTDPTSATWIPLANTTNWDNTMIYQWTIDSIKLYWSTIKVNIMCWAMTK
jgi:hypothetical protein